MQWNSSHTEHTYYALRKQLESAGVVTPNGETCIFAKAYAFSTPSAAAAVVLGQPTNGRLAWRVKGSSTTYHAWEMQEVGSTDSVGDVA